jgi:hypothetical protein
MICARCDKPILKDEAYAEVDKFSPSAGGAVLHVHVKKTCKRPYSQTAPHSIRH